MHLASDEVTRERLRAIHVALVDRAHELAVFLPYDRPSLVKERPATIGRPTARK